MRGSTRGITIYPKPTYVPPPEIVHTDSCIVPLPHETQKVMVTEWTNGVPDLHSVDLSALHLKLP